MGININGIAYDKGFSLSIKERDIRDTVVKIPTKYYQAKASIETWYGTVDITGSTLHNIIKQFLVQNKHMRPVIKGFIDQLDNPHEDLY